MYIILESYHTTKINIVLYISYTPIKKEKENAWFFSKDFFLSKLHIADQRVSQNPLELPCT